MAKSICDITLYELMAEDFSVWVKRNDKHGFDLHLESDDPADAVEETGIHPCAMEGFAGVCRKFLYFYEKAVIQMEKIL